MMKSFFSLQLSEFHNPEPQGLGIMKFTQLLWLSRLYAGPSMFRSG